MSKTIEEIKKEIELKYSFALVGSQSTIAVELAELYAQSQTQELTDWKESMMKVHRELDLQGIGTALRLPLGSSIAPQVLPKVKELIEQNTDLIEMLEKFKEEIINAYNQGRQDFAKYDPERHGNEFPDAESYYRTKYSHLNQL